MNNHHHFFQNPRATGSRILLFLTCVTLCLLFSCGENKTQQGSFYYSVSEQALSADGHADESVQAGKGSAAVSAEQVRRTLTWLKDDIRAVLSPSMLQTFIAAWPERIQQAEDEVRRYEAGHPADAQTFVLTLDTLRSDYARCLRNYQLPASDVQATLDNVQSRLNANPTREQFCRIRDVRIGFFRNLPTIHLVVREASAQPAIQSRAQRLQKRYLQLCQQYDLQP